MDAALLGLDPLFLTNVKLIIHDLLNLERVNEDLIDICGTIVAVERNSFTTNYTVDDSTGTITCSLWSAAEGYDYKPLEIGTAVRITGKISTFKDERQIAIYDIYPTLDPNQELQHFIHAILLRKEYAKEYKLPNVMKPHVQELIEQIQVDEQDQLGYNSQRKRVDKSTFEKAVLEFLRNHHVPMFSKDTARDNPTLTAMAVEILSNGRGKKPTKMEITYLFTKAVEKLLKEGYIVEIGCNETYKVVDEEYLAEFIVKSIRDMSKQMPDKLSGIRLEYIIKSISADKEYASLSKNSNIIHKIVSDLVEQSLIYATGRNEYKVFM
ncbi:hypothetical protein INT46_007452 [Mucor plumbeus]|uniref:CST complex subunit STN1 n=1 Tax=Mucor plumbeus TaxID=97098 RepID=A0A8H7VIJ2_9FUNG|nr:hypothetical protein INT46_007452 [Mucor plumbeus]